jgi:hypothetical protein
MSLIRFEGIYRIGDYLNELVENNEIERLPEKYEIQDNNQQKIIVKEYNEKKFVFIYNKKGQPPEFDLDKQIKSYNDEYESITDFDICVTKEVYDNINPKKKGWAVLLEIYFAL